MIKHLILIAGIILLFSFCIYLITGNTICLAFGIGISILLIFLVITIPINVFFYRLRTGKKISETRMGYYMILQLVALIVVMAFSLININHPTTPLGFLLRAAIVGLPFLGIYLIYKYRKKNK